MFHQPRSLKRKVKVMQNQCKRLHLASIKFILKMFILSRIGKYLLVVDFIMNRGHEDDREKSTERT